MPFLSTRSYCALLFDRILHTIFETDERLMLSFMRVSGYDTNFGNELIMLSLIHVFKTYIHYFAIL